MSNCFGGAWQIRTAVDGFADRYLASRSRHHIYRLPFGLIAVQR